MIIRLTTALLSGALFACLATAAVAAEERKPRDAGWVEAFYYIPGPGNHGHSRVQGDRGNGKRLDQRKVNKNNGSKAGGRLPGQATGRRKR